jgi:plasmid stabilization system protein ParE
MGGGAGSDNEQKKERLMPFDIVMLPGADIEIEDAFEWYELQRVGLGQVFMNELATYLEKIAQNPELFGFAADEYRRAVLPHFPYTVIYEVTGITVYVYAVFHSSRNPPPAFI